MPPAGQIYKSLIYASAAARVPVAVMCNLTFRCPLSCGHCYVARVGRASEELTLREYKDLFGQLATAGTLFLTLSGGEVLSRGDFLDILAAARERHFAVRVFTSGVGLDEAMAAALSRLHPVAVELSLHAATPELHDAFVGREGVWENAVAAARRLRALGVNVVLKLNAMNFNYDQVRPVFELARSMGADFRHTPIISVTNDGGTAPARLRMTDEQLREYYGTVKSWLGKRPDDDGADLCDEEAAARFRPNRYALSCMAAFNNCAINPYGTVWPCVSLPFDLGNVREKPLAEIWAGEEAERVRAYAKVIVAECEDCELDRYCFRCAATAVLEDGDITKAAREYCRVARAAKETLDFPLR